MAILDDPEWLLKHIQHSFITSDDTGMCEMVIQDNDLMTLHDHKRRLNEERLSRVSEKMHALPEMIGRSTPTSSPSRSSTQTSSSSTPVRSHNSLGDMSPSAPSPEISSGWDFGVRRRSNTAQKLERIRKERQSRIKVHSIPWRKRNDILTQEQIHTMFEKKDLNKNGRDCHPSECVREKPETEKTLSSLTTIKGRTESPEKHTVYHGFDLNDLTDSSLNLHTNDRTLLANGGVHECQTPKRTKVISGLAEMLKQSSEQYNNPFREYSKFDGRGQESGSNVKKINIFVWPYGSERPKFSTEVSVQVSNAKVQDVIGLACWQYTMENQEPKLQAKSVNRYSLYIAEDDGTVDRDFPALEPSEPFSKFGFPTLALVEKQRTLSNVNGEGENGVKESVFVKVNDHAGFSLIAVDDLSVTMGEILKKTLKRRKGQTYPGKYRLEYQDRIGVAVNEEQTLESTGVMEFYLVREHSTRSHTSNNAFEGGTNPKLGRATLRNDDYSFPPRADVAQSPTDNTFVFVPTMEYQTFRLNQLHKVRSATPVSFGVGPNQIDIEPVGRRESRSPFPSFLSPRAKALSIRVTMLAHCALQPSKYRSSSSLSGSPTSSSGGTISSPGVTASTSSSANLDFGLPSRAAEKQTFKLYYRQSENHPDFKHLTLEGPVDEVRDAVARVDQIMMLNGDARLQAAFEARKFGIPDNISSSSNSTMTTMSRKGSLFR